MTTVHPYISQVKKYFFCKKGEKHAQQPLNIVCLDPICCQRPLLCPTCVSQYHKYHRTIPLNIFLSDYQAAIKKNNIKETHKRIASQYKRIKRNVLDFKQSITKKLDYYIDKIDQYFIFLEKNLHIRQEISKSLNISLDANILANSTSCQKQLNQSVSFIIKNGSFSEQNRLINVSSILKFDQSRNIALLDKVINQNLKYQREINDCFEKLSFVQETIFRQVISLKNRVQQFNCNSIQIQNTLKNNIINHKQFVNKEILLQTLTLNDDKLLEPNLQKQSYLNNLFTLQKQISPLKINQNPNFQFHQQQKHEMLNIVDENDKRSIIRSNITALKPQYALICPSVDFQPLKQQNWSIKISNCRNFASKNTLAIGLCPAQFVAKNNFEQNSNTENKGYLVTSQGYLLKNGRSEKTQFRFSSGDIVNLKYDPFYRLLIFSKDNGRKLTIRLNQDQQKSVDKLYGCVRLTYASDQVQILNHSLPK